MRLAALLIGAAAAMLAVSVAGARSNFLNTWGPTYPGSLSDDNVIADTGSSCQLCHSETNGGDGWNEYGWAMWQELDAGASLSAAIANIEGIDSDGNGDTNLVEINASSQPGWTTGTVTIYFKDGSTATTTAPAITNLDPANLPPTADANGPYSGTVGVAVTFDGSGSSDSDGTIASYAWDFGDGNTGTGVGPTHTYASPGSYTVTLTVTDDGGATDSDTTTATISDVPNVPPTADPNGPYTGTAGVAVTFDGSGSSDSDGTIVSYAWDFGDGNTGTGVAPSHTYATGGVFTVTLTVTDDDGATDAATTTATINAPPVADPGGPYTGTTGVAVTFDGSGSSDSDGTIGSYAWDFGDGNTGTGVSPSHTYAVHGNYTVSLTVTDDDGATDAESTVATIRAPPTANAGGPYTGTAGAPVTFDGSGSTDVDGTIVSYAWDFGDGNSGTGVAPSHTYAASGVYTVTLTVTDDDGLTDADTASATIGAANVPPTANDDSYNTNEDATLTVSAPGVLGNDVDPDSPTLTASLQTDVSSGTLTFNSDGSFTYVPDADFNGSDTFTYRANDGEADSNTATVTITVDPVNDDPVAVGDSYATPAGVTLTVSAPGVLGNDTDVDGDSLGAVLDTDVSNGTLTLNNDGSFTYIPDGGFSGPDSFSYHANDGLADSNTVTVNITVAAGNAPVANDDLYSTNEDVTLSVPAPGVLGNDVDPDTPTLTAVLDTDVASGTLTLNSDGSFTYVPDADFNGSDSFTYHANDGTNDSNVATVTINVTAVNDDPVADAGGPYTGTSGVAVTFDGSASTDPDGTIVSYAWDFGDGNTGTGVTPSHTYAAGGVFIVTLTVTDNQGATNSATATATINAAPVADPAGPYTGTAGVAVTFDGSGSTDVDGTIVSYAWDFGDGNSGTGVAPSHTYASAGSYTVVLVVTDDLGATGTATTTATVQPAANVPPTAAAGGPYAGTVGFAITFDGSGSADSDGTIVSYAWDFGDGNTGTGVAPSHTYASGGVFTVTLTVTDDDGAIGVDTATVDVNAPPGADAGGPYSGIAGVAVSFDGSASSDSDGSVVSYLWDFGDGMTATGPTVSHAFSSAGSFTVTLTVTDDDGATDTDFELVTILARPTADAGGPYSGVAGSPLAFDGTGSFDSDGAILSYAWDFGDGTTGTGPTPSRTYAAAGTYTITLTVTDDDGLTGTDTTTAQVLAAPTAEAGGPYSAAVAESITFNGTASSDSDGSIVSYAWDFGDGATGTGITASHAYGAPGTFTVTLTVTDDDGLTGTDTATATVISLSGSVVYSQQCAACHGASGEGGIGPSLQASTLTLSQIVAIVTNGQGAMPEFSSTLTSGQIDAVASHTLGLQQPTATTTTTTIPAGATGSELYATQCAACHGANGEGGIGPSLQASTLTLSQVISIVTNGQGSMPGFSSTLSGGQIDSVSAHAVSLQDTTATTTTTTIPTGASGSELYASQCAACHGPNGEGGIGPSLVVSTLSTSQISAIIAAGRGSMPSFSSTLTSIQIDSIAVHAAGLQDTTATTTTTTIPVDASAAELFSLQCAACHGAGGVGGIGPSLVVSTLTASEISGIIAGGRGSMPSFSSTLTSSQISSLASYAAGLQDSTATTTTTTIPADISMDELYATTCAPCHGAAGEGDIGSSLQASTLGLGEIAAIIANGRNQMPAFAGTLTQDQIDGLAAVALRFQTDDPVTTTTLAPDASVEELFASRCAQCHGASGEGGIGPSLIMSQLTQEEIVSVIALGRGQMPGLAGVISEEQIVALAVLAAGLQGDQSVLAGSDAGEALDVTSGEPTGGLPVPSGTDTPVASLAVLSFLFGALAGAIGRVWWRPA